jgi:hypothetical protein
MNAEDHLRALRLDHPGNKHDSIGSVCATGLLCIVRWYSFRTSHILKPIAKSSNHACANGATEVGCWTGKYGRITRAVRESLSRCCRSSLHLLLLLIPKLSRVWPLNRAAPSRLLPWACTLRLELSAETIQLPFAFEKVSAGLLA